MSNIDFKFNMVSPKNVKPSTSYSSNPGRGGGKVVDPMFTAKEAKTTRACSTYTAPNKTVPVTDLYGVVVCVNYADYFLYSLESSKDLFKKIYVITTIGDEVTESLCRNYDNVEVIKTDVFYRNGSDFDKGAAINIGLDRIPRNLKNWTLIYDADIVFPEYFKRVIKTRCLNARTLYGAIRHFARTKSDYDRYVKSKEDFTKLPEAWSPRGTPIGYFQLFNSLNRERYPENHKDASHSDMLFSRKFKYRTTLKSCRLVHLGDTNTNWSGRVTPFFETKSKAKRSINVDGESGARALAALIEKHTYSTFSKDLVPTSGIKKNKELAIMTCYFNPDGRRNIRTNYEVFRQHAEVYADVYTIELSLGSDEPHIKGPPDRVLHIRGKKSKHQLWQKERLLNILSDHVLERDYGYIGWFDCDVLFSDKDWAHNAVGALQDSLIIHPFSGIGCLDHTLRKYSLEGNPAQPSRFLSSILYWDFIGQPDRWSLSFKSNFKGRDLEKHLITPANSKCGLAWVACREFFENIKLIDRCIVGGGDAVMTGAFTETLEFWWAATDDQQPWGKDFVRDFRKWSKDISDLSMSLGKKKILGTIDGTVFHMNHGSRENRRYSRRRKPLKQANCNVYEDICIDSNGLLTFTESGIDKGIPKLLRKYFSSRQEDEFINDYSLLKS